MTDLDDHVRNMCRKIGLTKMARERVVADMAGDLKLRFIECQTRAEAKAIIREQQQSLDG